MPVREKNFNFNFVIRPDNVYLFGLFTEMDCLQKILAENFYAETLLKIVGIFGGLIS